MRLTIVLVLMVWTNTLFGQLESSFKKALKQGHWNQTTSLITQWAEDCGISHDANLIWTEAELTQLYNYYDNKGGLRPEIAVSTFPDKTNIWEYWRFWSESLTDNKWNPKDHFKNKKHALRMGRYNVLMLLAHEFGHHLADRYDAEREPLNCKELDADRLAFALNKSLVRNGYFRKCSEEYRHLLFSINESIDLAEPFNLSDSTQLEFNCAAMQVRYPSDSSLMKQYAAAYFKRWEYLYNSGISSSSIFDDIILKKDIEFKKKYPFKPAKLTNVLTFTDHYHVEFGYSFKRGVKMMRSWGASPNNIRRFGGFGFDSAGKLYHVQISADQFTSPADLWDIRLYDTAGSLSAFWLTSPPITDTFAYMELASVSIQDAADNIMLLISLYNKYDKSDERLFLLYPDEYLLRMEWIEILNRKPEDMRVVPDTDGSRHYLISSTPTQPDIRFLGGESRALNVYFQSITSLTPGEVSHATAIAPVGYYSGSPGYIVQIHSTFGITLYGNGVARNGKGETPPILAMRNIGDQLFTVSAVLNRNASNRGHYQINIFDSD